MHGEAGPDRRRGIDCSVVYYLAHIPSLVSSGGTRFVQEKPRIVDLFCGCGGFSFGAHAAGLAPTLAFDVDPILTSSFRTNYPGTKLVLTDLSRIEASDIRRYAGKK